MSNDGWSNGLVNVSLIDELVDAFNKYVEKCEEFEEKTGISVCAPGWVQLSETLGGSPFAVANALKMEPEDRGMNGTKYRTYGIVYNGVDIHWLVG